MPRTSTRAETLATLEQVLWRRIRAARHRYALQQPNEHEDFLDDRLRNLLLAVQSHRYMVPRRPKPCTGQRFAWLLDGMRDDDFKREFRLDRARFRQLVDRLQHHPIFAARGDRTQATPAVQLLVTLKHLGMNGLGASYGMLAGYFSIGSGTVYEYIQRCHLAIFTLRGEYIRWPDAQERRQIAASIERLAFQHIVGFVDGTLFPLDTKPADQGEAYYTRKGCYAVTAVIVCDHARQIRFVNTGWPGSAHDQRVLSNSTLMLQAGTNFSPRQYILGDSAYTPHVHVVPAFKKAPGQQLRPDHEQFNTLLGRARITVEHCIGILKARFQSLKGLRYTLRGAADMLRIVRHIEVAIILHNFCGADPLLPDWMDEFALDADGPDAFVQQDVQQAANAHQGKARREQVVSYLKEINVL